MVLFRNKICLLFPFRPPAAVAASWNMKHVSDQCFLNLFLLRISELLHCCFNHLVRGDFCPYVANKA